MKEKIKQFVTKHFSTLQDSVFSILLMCSLTLNILLYLSLSDLIFDKLILGTVAGCIQFMEVYLLQKMKRYWLEKYSGDSKNALSRLVSVFFYKRLPAVLFTVLYISVTMLSIAAAYSFSLKSIYNASIKQSIVLNNEEDIKIKEESLKSKDLQIASLESLRDAPKASGTIGSNSELINDYNNKIIISEKRISELSDDISRIKNQINNLTEDDAEYSKLKQKEKNTLSNIVFEQNNVSDYKNKKNKLLTEESGFIGKAKKEQEEAQKQYESYNSKIEVLRKEKIAINQEIKTLKQEDEDNRKKLNKTQYQLVAENLTQIIYLKENKGEDNKITEEQVRAILLGIFSIMIEVGLLLTARKEETIERRPNKKRAVLKLDNKEEKQEYKEQENTELDEPETIQTENFEIESTEEKEEEKINIVAEEPEKTETPEEPKKQEIPEEQKIEHPMKIMSLEREIEKMLNDKPVLTTRVKI